MTLVRAVIYCRVSTKEQTKNLSIATQLKACRDYCSRNGLTVAQEFLEQGESAKTADRTELQAMLAYCREYKGKVQALVVYNVSRFARERFSHVTVRAQLLRLGVTLRSVSEPIDDSSTGKLMEAVVSAVAQFDNDQKAERTATGMQAALKLGRWTFKAPLGYVNAPSRIGPSLVPDPKRAVLITSGFQQVAAGDEVASVLRRLVAAGLTGVSGRALSLQTFRTLLRSPILCGRIEVPKWTISVTGDFEPLVAEATFRRVQVLLSAKSARPTHVKDREDFPLRRFLRCAKCCRPVSASWSTGRNGRYGYYHCPKCPGVRGRRTEVESGFVDHLTSMQPDPAYIRLFNSIVLDVWSAEQSGAREVARLKSGRVDELAARLDRLDEAFIYERSIGREAYNRQRDKLHEQLALAEMELHEAKIDEKDVEGVLSFAEFLLLNAGRVWQEGSLSQRQQIQRAIFPDGLPFDGRGFGTATTC